MTFEEKQSSICEVAVRIKRAVVEIQDVYRVAIDHGNDPATLRLWNVQGYLLAGLEELCRSVRLNLRDYQLYEAVEWEPGIRAATLSRECDEAISEFRPSRLRRMLEARARGEAEAPPIPIRRR